MTSAKQAQFVIERVCSSCLEQSSTGHSCVKLFFNFKIKTVNKIPLAVNQLQSVF